MNPTVSFSQKFFLTLIISTLFSISAKSQTVFEDWVATKGFQDMYLYAKAVTDASGNVYQAGATLNDFGNYDAMVTKYDRYGVEQWSQLIATSGDETFTDIVLGASGKLFLTGGSMASNQSSSSVITARLSHSTGAVEWSDTYSYSGSIFNLGASLVRDASNNVYVTGFTQNLTTMSDVLALKYNSSGMLQWGVKSDIYGLQDGAVKAVLHNNRLIVSGATQSGTNAWRYLTQAYVLADGSLLGNAIGGSIVTSIDQVQDMVTDSDDNIYITGTAGTTSQGYNMYTVKLDDELDILWEKSYNYAGSGDDKAFGMALDSSGNVIVTGCTSLSATNTQFTTIKYTAGGVQSWVRHYDISTERDTAKAVTVDTEGNIYISGTFFNGSNRDIKTLKYNSSGTLQWEIDFNGVHNGDDYVNDVTYDDDRVLVIIQSKETSTFQYKTISYVQKDVIFPPDEEEIPTSMYFTKNVGQLVNTSGVQVPSVKYIDQTDYPAVYVQDNGLSYVFVKADSLQNDTIHRVDMIFNKKNTNQKMYALDEIDFYQNFYKPTVTDGRRERVKSYDRLVGVNVWDNIDLMISHNNRGLKYYLICKPGFNPANISWEYNGATSISTDANGQLIIQTPVGSIAMPKGEAYEITSSGVRQDKSWQPSFNVTGNGVSISLGSYDISKSLILEIDKGDPVSISGVANNGNMLWNSYYASSSANKFKDVVTDSNGGIYITGELAGADFPSISGSTIGAYTALTDVIILKINQEIVPQWLTYFGGSGNDVAMAMDIKELNGDAVINEIYICGYTDSENLPINTGGGIYQVDNLNDCTTGTCFDGFVAQVNLSGILSWSTYFGNDGDEKMRDIKVDILGNIYVVGRKNTNTELQIRNGAENYTAGNGLIVRYDINKNRDWVTSWDAEMIYSVAVDIDNNVYTTGGSYSTNMPILNYDLDYPETSLKTTSNNLSAFVNKFNTDGELEFSFYFGSDCYVVGTTIAIDPESTVYVAGNKNAINSPTSCIGDILIVGGQQSDLLSDFVLKFRQDNSEVNLLYSSGIGGSYSDGVFYGGVLDVLEGQRARLAVTNSGIVFLSSYTGSAYNSSSTGIPLAANPPLNYYVKDNLTPFSSSISGLGDDYLIAFDQNMDIIWSTYHGSNKYDYNGGLAISKNNDRLILVGTGNHAGASVEYNAASFDPEEFSLISTQDYFQQFPLQSGVNYAFGTVFDIGTIDIPLGLKNANIADNNVLKIWPNPAKTTLNISSDFDVHEVLIYDSMGRLIQSHKKLNGLKVISVTNLASGVYFVAASNDNSKSRVKFIKL